MISITKRFRFEAAHRLEDWPHDHQCHRLHGHSYVLEVSVVVDPTKLKEDKRKPGAILDFAEVSTIVKHHIISKWDHQYLNDVLGMKNTTAEKLVVHIWNVLSRTQLGEYDTLHIQLSETESGWAKYGAKTRS